MPSRPGETFLVMVTTWAAVALVVLPACSHQRAPAAPSLAPPASTAAARPVSASPSAPITPAALQFPGHLLGARTRSTYTGQKTSSVSWESAATTRHWLLRSACTSARGGAQVRYEVSYARGSADVEDEEQLLVADGTISCDGKVHVNDIGKLKHDRVAVELYVDDRVLRAYGIVVPGRT